MTAPIIRSVPFNSSTWTSSSSIRSAIASVVWPALVSPTATAFRSSVDVPRPPGGRNVARGCDTLPAAASLLVAASLLLITGCGGSDDPATTTTTAAPEATTSSVDVVIETADGIQESWAELRPTLDPIDTGHGTAYGRDYQEQLDAYTAVYMETGCSGLSVNDLDEWVEALALICIEDIAGR